MPKPETLGEIFICWPTERQINVNSIPVITLNSGPGMVLAAAFASHSSAKPSFPFPPVIPYNVVLLWTMNSPSPLGIDSRMESGGGGKRTRESSSYHFLMEDVRVIYTEAQKYPSQERVAGGRENERDS